MAKPSSSYHRLTDGTVTISLATALLDKGYYPVPVGANSDGKSWLIPADGIPVHQPDADGNPPSVDQVMAAFEQFPQCGISIATPYLRPPYSNDLLILDVDIDDTSLLQTVADIIGTPCPVKKGNRGLSFIVRYPAMNTVPTILRERSLVIPNWVKDSKLQIPSEHGRTNAAIDLLGLKIAHSLIPPTISIKASTRLKVPTPYEWAAFPGTRHIIPIDEVHPRDLPELQHHHMLLIFQYLKNPKSSLFGYIGQTDVGNHHDPMLSASTYMWHERFTQEEITGICYAEAERTSSDEDNAEDRRNEIRIAVKKLPVRIPEQKPSNISTPARSKVPMDRRIADYLISEYGADNLGNFAGIAHHWYQERWHQIVELDHPTNPWANLYRHVLNTFAEANHAAISSAIKSFSTSIRTRQAAPNKDFVPFRNGLLDVHDHSMRDQHRDDFILHTLEHDFDPAATCPLWDRFINELMVPPLDIWPDETDMRASDQILAVQAVEEFFGYCLVQSHEYQKMLHVIGKPDTGKSVLFKVLRGLLPKTWLSTVAMDAFGDPNSLIQMATSYVNVAAEVGRRAREVDDVLLRVTAGEDVAVKLLYANKLQVILPTRLIFQGNLPPDTTDGTGAIQRRILMVRTTDIKPEKKIPYYEQYLLKEAQGILLKLVRAYKRLLDRGYFMEPEYSRQIIEDARIESNSALMWMHQCTNDVEYKDATHNQELFDHFVDWCSRTKMYQMSMVHWGKQLTAAGKPSRKKRNVDGSYMQCRELRLKTNIHTGVSY